MKTKSTAKTSVNSMKPKASSTGNGPAPKFTKRKTIASGMKGGKC